MAYDADDVWSLSEQGWSVRQIAAHLALSPTTVQRLKAEAQSMIEIDMPCGHTPRCTPARLDYPSLRKDVLILMGRGHTREEAAQSLGISLSTVRYLLEEYETGLVKLEYDQGHEQRDL